MMQNSIEIYKSEDNQVEVNVRLDKDTVWLNRQQLSVLFDRDIKTIGKHINNVFSDGELEFSSTVAKFATVQIEGTREVEREIEYYNLDVIISVGYRVKSQRGVQFRQWATQRLKDYLIKGYAINHQQLEKNKAQFLQTLADLKILTEGNSQIEAKDILTLIQNFSDTFFALNSYDKNIFPAKGTKEEVETSAEELEKGLAQLKAELIRKGEATQLFAQEKTKGNLEGIFGNVFQSVFGQDAYPTFEEKAAHLLYFIIKNHPFNDGNKRSGAFSFIWFLKKAKKDFIKKISPEALTTLTLLIAESNPKDKDRMIGLVLLLLNSGSYERI
ncbi:MAG: death-on-curing protein [Ignavibacteriales bacterium UTCHB2]|nr:MAG: death-on-curing protein [Ignavibacteriales bacterium UTCHB2]